jgi:glycosyltransferase involved in cell wall biosynthesis
MRICHLIKGLGRGGAEMLLPWLIEEGRGEHTFSVGFFLPWKNELVGAAEAAGARVRCFGGSSHAALLLRVGAVARWLRSERAEVLHCHLPLAGVVGRLAARRAGVPVVYTEHNLLERYHAATRWAELSTWKLQRAVVAVSQEVATSITRHAGDTIPVRVIRNGIPTSNRRSTSSGSRLELRARLGIDAAAPVVGTVAVMRSQKRLDLWLDAAAEIRKRIPAARFLLVGDGPLRARLERRAQQSGLAGAVVFTGLQSDIGPYLDLIDLYLMSSQFEGLPVALLEAMAAGIAVVATDVGGISEVVRDGEVGRLVPFGDASALAEASLSLLGSRERRLQMGEAGYRRVRSEFGIERMASDLGDLYREVAGGLDVAA